MYFRRLYICTNIVVDVYSTSTWVLRHYMYVRSQIDAANARAAHTRCNYNVSYDESACIRDFV